MLISYLKAFKQIFVCFLQKQWFRISEDTLPINNILSVMNLVAVKLANNNREIPFSLYFKHQQWMYVYMYVWMDVCIDRYIFTNKYLHIYIINK